MLTWKDIKHRIIRILNEKGSCRIVKINSIIALLEMYKRIYLKEK